MATPNNYTTNPDIVNAIISKLMAAFAYELIYVPVQAGLPAYLKRIDRYPLQDDPTDTSISPFVLIDFDRTKGLEPDMDHPPTVQGPVRYKLWFKANGWVPQSNDKVDVFSANGELWDLIVKVIEKYWDLEGLTAADGDYVTGCNRLHITKATFAPFGGDNEWYSKYGVEFFFYIVRGRYFSGDYQNDPSYMPGNFKVTTINSNGAVGGGVLV